MVGHIKNILESYGIVCTIEKQFSSAAAGEIPAIECWPELWIIDKEQLEQAKEVVKETLAPLSKELPKWECTYCNEHIDGQFTACWSCGKDRPANSPDK